MPLSLSNVAIQSFNDSFINEFQASAMLGDTCQAVYNAVGDAYKWPVQGIAEMQDRGALQSLLPASDVSYDNVVTSFTNKVLSIPVDIFQKAEINSQINILSSLATIHASASGRMEDQFLIDALNAAAVPAGNTIAAGGTNMTVDKLLQASAILDENNVPMEDRYLAITPSQLQSLLNEDKTTSALYVNDRNLVDGRLMNFLGFNIYTLGNRSGVIATGTQGGLPVAAGVRTCFAWQRSAVGRVYSITPTTEVEYSAAHSSWLTISKMRLGASSLLDNGIVKIECAE